MLRIGVLVSGRGSNLQALIDAIESGQSQASIEIVISNKADAFALQRAERHGIKNIILDPKAIQSEGDARQHYDQNILGVLEHHKVGLVVLAGYMRIVTPVLTKAYPWKIMNIHPSLLPAFPDLNAQKQALEWGAKISGCTVHFVSEGVDEGPIIMQASVPIQKGDTVETLSARILEQEHRIYPQAIQLFAEGKLSIEGRRVRIADHDPN